MGLWGSSYLVQTKGVSLETAARWVAFYYAGITIGRVIAGFVSFKLSNTLMITLGLLIALLGGILLFIEGLALLTMIAFVLIGLGFAPVFPSMTHETPHRFGKEHTQHIIGFQMASAYIGIAVFPPVLGFVIEKTSMSVFPVLDRKSVV